MKRFFKIEQKLQGSTVIEVIIALLICMIIFTLSMKLLLQTQKDSNILMKVKALIKLSHYNLSNSSLDEEDVKSANLNISMETSKADSLSNISKVNINVKDNQGKLLCRKVIWIKEDTNNTGK